MKINAGLPPVLNTTTVQAPAKARPVDKVPGSLSVEVSLSNSLRPETGSTEAPLDAAKVARLRQAIQDGTYKVSAESLADKMLVQSQLELRRS